MKQKSLGQKIYNLMLKIIQVEQRYFGSGKHPQDLDTILGQASTQEVKDALDANVDQITTV